MTDKTLSTVIGSGGGSLIFPTLAVSQQRLFMKNSTTAIHAANSATFYTSAIASTSSTFETATLEPVADTLEQTIIDTGTGKEGIVTQILTPLLASGAAVTIRVTLDGEVTTLTFTTGGGGAVVCFGDFLNYSPSGTLGVGVGGTTDAAFSSIREIYLPTPEDTISRGVNVGLVFEDSLKITIQSDIALIVGSSTNKAYAAWLNYLPEGVS